MGADMHLFKVPRVNTSAARVLRQKLLIFGSSYPSSYGAIIVDVLDLGGTPVLSHSAEQHAYGASSSYHRTVQHDGLPQVPRLLMPPMPTYESEVCAQPAEVHQ